MAYTLITAAAATGVNRTIILRAIKAGKISAERDAQGAWKRSQPMATLSWRRVVVITDALDAKSMVKGGCQRGSRLHTPEILAVV
jgi:hypothetical protein